MDKIARLDVFTVWRFYCTHTAHTNINIHINIRINIHTHMHTQTHLGVVTLMRFLVALYTTKTVMTEKIVHTSNILQNSRWRLVKNGINHRPSNVTVWYDLKN